MLANQNRHPTAVADLDQECWRGQSNMVI